MIRILGTFLALFIGVSQFCYTAAEAKDRIAPRVTGFLIPPSATSLTVPITTFTGSDNISVTGYYVSESSTVPLASSSGWWTTKPTSYTFSSAGAKTLYARVRDATGNISASVSDVVTITLPGDTIAPSVTSFLIAPSASSLTVPITMISGSDNISVTGYYVSESNTVPLASSSGWTATKPTSYTFASAGTKTLYARVKDAAGNVSASLSDVVTITLSGDTIAPRVTGFLIPPSANSLTVPITTFTGSDNISVTGYYVSESNAVPLASSSGWRTTTPTSYTFASAGTKTLYARVRDAAGNISGSLSDVVTITLSGDTIAPSVTGFLIPASASSLTVPITTFTASDNVGVTGYHVSESAIAPLASSSSWTATKPTSYTFASAGTKTLYARVKDAAGNISASRSAVVTITLVTPTLGSVAIGWDAVTTYTDGSLQNDLVGYKVYYGTASGIYSNSLMVSNPSATYAEITGLQRGVTYYFVVTAISVSGGESDYSGEVNYVIQ